jgi:cytochrome c biogenesis protein CcdA/thiol-disulfide isomerase/thioredoxin
MLLFVGSFIAGLLTVLAPCVLPLLPIIIGGSLTNSHQSRRPIIIAASLAVSLTLFTLLLKATTLLINVPPQIFTYISGGIVIILGLLILFPQAYALLTTKLKLEQTSQNLLSQGARQPSTWGAIATGAALGPVFSSCSPVYVYIVATILPVSLGQAMLYIISYAIGLSLMLLLIGYFGQRLVQRVKFAANPHGWFQRSLAIIFIVVGLLVITGYDKRFQTWVSAHTAFNFDSLSAQLIPNLRQTSSDTFNVEAYPAPELKGLTNWINSQPVTLQQLHGKVVLIDFWTYSCINCLRSVPYIQKWYDQYKDDGFVAIGVHAPEFAFERQASNVSQAVKDLGLTYPIALDNSYQTWTAFNNQYWPAHYLIDASGQVRRVHFGEGEYNQTEAAIRQLLQQNGATLTKDMVTTGQEVVPIVSAQTPETYLGTERANNFDGQPNLSNGTHQFHLAENLSFNSWSLGGSWQIDDQTITSKDNSHLTFRVAAKEVYLVAGADQQTNVNITINGQPISQTGFAGADVHNSQVAIKESKLYRLVNFDQFASGNTLELSLPSGVKLNAFTFGGK